MSTTVEDPSFLPLDGVPVVWTEDTLPAQYWEPHEAPARTWTRYSVRQGEIRFTTWAPGRRSAVLAAGQSVMLPPLIKHAFSPDGPVRLTVQLFRTETDLDGKRVLACPVCRGLLETGTNHDGCRESPDYPGVPQKRFYGRPRPGESVEEFSGRFKEGVVGMIAERRHEHPGSAGQAQPPPDDPARARAQARLARLRPDHQASMEPEAEGTA